MDYGIKASHRTELLVVEFNEKCENNEASTHLIFQTMNTIAASMSVIRCLHPWMSFMDDINGWKSHPWMTLLQPLMAATDDISPFMDDIHG